jgi:hypothetical protein
MHIFPKIVMMISGDRDFFVFVPDAFIEMI